MSGEPASTAGRRAQVAVASVGDPEQTATWSGIPAGVVGGLRGVGVATRAVNLALPPGLEQALLVAGAAPTRNLNDREGSPLAMSVRGLLARRRLHGGEIDGAIQIGSTFTLAAGTRYVTLEDMTLRQGARAYPVFSAMSPRAIASWERRRAQIYRRALMCAVASHWAADSLVEDYGIERERIAVVGFGANHGAGAPDRDWSAARFLFVGVQWQRKGGPLLLRAFARVRAAHPDAVLDVVGGHPRLNQPGVRGHGMLSRADARESEQMAELLARATCLVMPSAVEPFGIAHVEAAAAGVASIGTSVGAPREVLGEDGGVVVEPGDEDALAEAMLRLSDAETARRMGAAALVRSRLYTWERVAERLLRALGLPAPDGRALAEFL